jgi:hypothetical protein
VTIRYMNANKPSASAIKRALTQEQLQGASATSEATTTTTTTTDPKSDATPTGTTTATAAEASKAPLTKPPSANGGAGGGDPSSGGGDFMLPLAVVATTLGAAWYFNFIPGMGPANHAKREPTYPAVTVPQPVTDTPVNQPVVEPTPTTSSAATTTTTSKKIKTKKKKSVETNESDNATKSAVVEDAAPPVTKVQVVPSEPLPVVESTAVPIIADMPKDQSPISVPEPELQPEPIVVESTPEPPTPPVSSSRPPRSKEPVLASVVEATRELTRAANDEMSHTLQVAHQALRASVDESLYKDLEHLSLADLKIRIVQLGTELTERTKWEAVRLKEFLAMKEKEVAEKYVFEHTCYVSGVCIISARL